MVNLFHQLFFVARSCGGVAGIGSPLDAVLNLPASILNVNLYSFFLALITMAIVFLTPTRISRIIPLPVLAGILIKVGVDILDYRPMVFKQILTPHFTWLGNILIMRKNKAVLVRVDIFYFQALELFHEFLVDEIFNYKRYFSTPVKWTFL